MEMLLLLAVGMVIGSARITRRRMLESLAATVAVPYLGAKERLDDAELIESRFAPLSCEIFAAAQKTRRHWSRILRPLSYEQYLQEYEQSQELRANIIKVLEELLHDKHVSQDLRDLLKKSIKHVVIVKSSEKHIAIAGVNKPLGIEFLSPSYFLKANNLQQLKWLVAYFVIHLGQHIARRIWNEHGTQALTMRLVEPLGHLLPSHYGQLKFVMDSAAARDPAALAYYKAKNEGQHAKVKVNPFQPFINAMRLMGEKAKALGLGDGENILYERMERGQRPSSDNLLARIDLRIYFKRDQAHFVVGLEKGKALGVWRVKGDLNR